MRRGFTLVELLVAVLISAFVLMAVYSVFINSTGSFYLQEQIGQAQSGLRFGMEYFKTDLRNAGRLAVINGGTDPNHRDPLYCRSLPTRRAVELIEEDLSELPAVLSSVPNSIVPDKLRLLVDASGGLPLSIQSISGDKVIIAPAAMQTSLAARRLMDGASEGRFLSDYSAGHFLYLSDPATRASDMVAIKSVTFGPRPEIILEQTTCLNVAQCASGGCRANPVEWIEYAILGDDNETDVPPVRTNLVRRALDAKTGLPMADRTVIVAERAVDLQVWGTFDTRTDLSLKPVISADDDPRDTRGNWEATSEAEAINARPERLRALTVMMAVRTSREDQEFTLALGYGDQANRVAMDRTWLDLDGVRDNGLARVATLVSEVETPNLYRGLR